MAQLDLLIRNWMVVLMVLRMVILLTYHFVLKLRQQLRLMLEKIPLA
jgi:hypothetical protein